MVDAKVFIRRSISTLILWSIVLGTVIAGFKFGTWLIITSFGLAGQWEFYRAQAEKGLRMYAKCGLFCGLLLFANSWLFLLHSPDLIALSWPVEGAIIVGAMIGALVRLVVLGEPKTTPIVSVALTMLGLIYVPYLFNFVARIAFWPDSLNDTKYVLLYLLAVTKFSDIGAYVFGSLFGKHKMIPRVSPGKTWEGFTGGMLSSMAMSLFLVWLLPTELPGIGWYGAVILGILLPLASVVGDLAESVVKRDASIKDSGSTIPGIGGALDLIDSILFTAPVLFYYLYFSLYLKH